MNILVLNVGSSTLKFHFYRIEGMRTHAQPEEVLARGKVEAIGSQNALMTLYQKEKVIYERRDLGVLSLDAAITEILKCLAKPCCAGEQPIEIKVIGHRIVHGGAQFFEPVIVDAPILNHLRALSPLAPLHNPLGISGIECVRNLIPGSCNVAVFDTAFHHKMPAVASRYALPTELCQRLALRRYGFHGISYQYVHERLKLLLGNDSQADILKKRVIICHLGSGASVCAIRDGQSIDTSMGFTPLEGLIMGTRGGDIDPGILLYLLRTGDLSLEQVDEVLNQQSGLFGLSEKSSDLRELEKAASDGHAASELAMECFAYRVCKYIGAYAVALGGVDCLVFTGGIGENSSSMRSRICARLSFLGLSINETRNSAATGNECVAIGSANAQHVWIIPTNEELQIAREVFTLMS